MAMTSLVLLVAEMISSRDWNDKQFYVLIHLNDSNSLMILIMILLVFFFFLGRKNVEMVILIAFTTLRSLNFNNFILQF